uniref:Uncharacterized protein n=1 Tax=Magallana gigas TaxID=29159 RepID=A0A8W8MWR2_MAGGI
MLNIYNGTVIGFEDTVAVKIPVIAKPSLVAKNASSLDLDDQAITVKNIVIQPGNLTNRHLTSLTDILRHLQKSDVTYRHLIIRVVPWNGVEQNRTYSVNYGGRLLTKITIDSKDLQKPASERFQNRELRFLISICLPLCLVYHYWVCLLLCVA